MSTSTTSNATDASAVDSPGDNARGATNSNKMTIGSLYPARVTSINRKAKTVDVRTMTGQLVKGCRVMAEGFAYMIGITSISMPPIGTQVLLVYLGQNTPCIFGVGPDLYDIPDRWIPQVTGDTEFEVTKKLDNLNKDAQDPQPKLPGIKMEEDMLPGEWEMSSGMGPLFRLFFNFAQMSAGDLAKIEVHLMNDMVRIVDNYFAHHNVGGDTLIWSNGRCNYESHFTGYPHEAEGKTGESEAIGTGEDYKAETKPDEFSATGRWRKSTYVGFLGDMIHTFVTSPTEVASTFMEGAFRGGQFRQWVGADGTFFVQAAGGVHIEMNPDVVVPNILKAWNDPSHQKDFLDGTAMKSLDKSFLKMWGEGPDWRDMKVACWQMRTYLKYIPLWHSLARFKQMEKKNYCKIPKESELPESNRHAEEKDKKEINSSSKGGTYHCALSMDMSGSIALVSNDHTSIIMNQGNVQIACPGNIELKAGNTVHISGKDVSIQSADRMELISFAGTLYAKARSALNILCEKGRLFLKSDGDPEDKSKDASPFDDSEIKSDVELEAYSIVMDAPKGKILAHGAKAVTLGTTEQEADICIETKGGESCVNTIATKYVRVKGSQGILMHSVMLGIQAITKIINGALKIGESLLMRERYIGLQGNIITQSIRSESGFVGGESEHVAKTQVDPAEVEDEKADEAGGLAAEMSSTESFESHFKTDELQPLKWKLAEWEVGSQVDEWDSLKASMWDDFAENNVNPGEQLQKDKPEKMGPTKITELKLKQAPRTEVSNLPFPGKSGKIFYFSDKQAKALSDKWDKDFSKGDIGGVSKMTSKPYQFYFRKQK